jgi:tRNA U54 and U55 pseudouridine synthase Pus10
LKKRPPTEEAVRELLARLNEYAKVQDTPARVEDLKVLLVKDRMETSFRLVPLGDMDARKWHILNQDIEKVIQEFLASDLKPPQSGHSSKQGR